MKGNKSIIIGTIALLLTICLVGNGFSQTTAAPQDKEDNPPLIISPYQGAKPGEKRDIEISLDNMDIYPVLDQLLGDILGLNFVVEPAIKGTISVHIKGRYSKKELLDLINSVLQMQGLAITPGVHGLYKVVRKANSPKLGGYVETKVPPQRPGDVIRVIQLEYLSAVHAVSNLRNLVSPGAVLIPVTSSNSIIISDTAENVAKVSKVLSILDENIFKNVYWKLFTLENADIENLAKDLESIFSARILYKRPGIDTTGIKIIPLKTLNALLVVTRWKKVMDQVARWVHELDQGQLGSGSKVYVYFVQNGKAKELAEILNELYGEASSSSKNRRVLVRREVKKKDQKSLSTGELSGEVKIIADETNNSLIFKARPKDYAIIRDVLKKLDIVPRQVLIEVLIAEVSLTNDVKYGVEWFIENKGINISGSPYNANMMLDAGKFITQDTPLGKGFPGFTYALYDGDGTLRALIHLLAENTDVDILSAPNIIAADNQEARIEIGEDVPTLSESTISSGGVKTQGVQYRKTGIILQVKPFINDSGLVRMEVTQEVSKVNDQATAGITSPRITNRKATTYIIARDGQHILMGGLMSTQYTEVHSGIPVLKDIPVLGYLFGSKGTKKEKKELIFILTPHVIRTRAEADRITREFATKVHSLKRMLEEKRILRENEKRSNNPMQDESGEMGNY